MDEMPVRDVAGEAGAVDEQDRFVPREVLRWGAGIALGFGLFVLGMSLA